MRTKSGKQTGNGNHREAPITVRMDKATKKELRAYCRESDLSVSQLIRRAVKRELAAIRQLTAGGQGQAR